MVWWIRCKSSKPNQQVDSLDLCADYFFQYRWSFGIHTERFSIQLFPFKRSSIRQFWVVGNSANMHLLFQHFAHHFSGHAAIFGLHCVVECQNNAIDWSTALDNLTLTLRSGVDRTIHWSQYWRKETFFPERLTIPFGRSRLAFGIYLQRPRNKILTN